jgi:hypothetical protein
MKVPEDFFKEDSDHFLSCSFFSFLVGGETESIWYCGHFLAYGTSPRR